LPTEVFFIVYGTNKTTVNLKYFPPKYNLYTISIKNNIDFSQKHF